MSITESTILVMYFVCRAVVNAKNIIPLDSNGLSDPFVIVELCPKHMFAKQQQQTTKVVKKTLNPTFDEQFDL